MREMVEFCTVKLREPTAERRPNNYNGVFTSRAAANVPCNNSSEVQLTIVDDVSICIHVILVMLYSTVKLVNVNTPNPTANSVVTVVTLLRLRFSSGVPFTSHSTPTASILPEIQLNSALPSDVDITLSSLQPRPTEQVYTCHG